MKNRLMVALLVALVPLVICSHIDDINGELSNLKYQKVVMRTTKDCSLDKMPGVSMIRPPSSNLILDQSLFGRGVSQVSRPTNFCLR